ncbi:hypothetical protein DXU07_08700 [Bradyrhizobium elkanii]|nr:hypothetical protein XI02_10655 [Bradyrhizobium sp. CCBAU 21365]
MVSRYREPDADALPLRTHYRPSREDERLIREAAEARFGRQIGEKKAGGYASGLRKLAVALRPSSIAKLSDDKLLGHAVRLFRNDKTLIAALNALRDYRAIVGRGNLGAEGGSSRQVIQPPSPLPMRPVDEQRLGSAADRDASLPADGFNTLQVWHEPSLAPHSPIHSVAQDELFDTAEQSSELSAPGFDAPLLSQQMRSATSSPAPSFTQEELFDAVTGWQRMHSATSSPVQSFLQEELFDAVTWRPSPRPNFVPENYFGRMMDQGAAAQTT